MANRHLSRSVILQTLFEWDFQNKPEVQSLSDLKRNTEEFAPGLEDDAYMQATLSGILNKITIIDEIIQKAAPEWPLAKISSVDRNVLRMGLYELLFADRKEVPPKVAINEAIELAKTFGGDSSGRFVNGVLGAVYKEIGEPGKDETAKKKKKTPAVPLDPALMPIEQKAGAVVYAKDKGEIYFALVHDVFGYWTLSKGGAEEGENIKDAAIREIKDEMGLDIKIKDELGESEYIAYPPGTKGVRKHVTFFLAESDYVPVTLGNDSGGLNDAKWFPMSELANITTYEDVLGLLTKAVEILTAKK